MGNMPKINFQRVIFLIIIALTIFLRFYKLNKIPPSLNWDEAALGYNAYSILKTGRDEYGIRFPLVFRSFGDYKPPLYTYLTIPSILIFGLNEFAGRFPSAFFGSLTVVVGYFLVKALFPNLFTNYYLLITFLFAISPWHLQFSRGAFEANLGLFLTLFGTYLFIKALKEKVLLPFSAIVFSLSLYVYHSLRVFAPLLVFSLFFLYRKELLKIKKWVGISFLIGLFFLFPLVKSFIQGETLARFSGVSAFGDPDLLMRSIKKIEEDGNSIIARTIHNRRIVYTTVFLTNYLSHFDPNFLFIQADQNPRHHAPANGLLYFWEIMTIPVGLFVLGKTKGKGKFVVASFLFLAPIAAAPATGAPHAIRSLNAVPAWIVISGFGLAYLFKKLEKIRFLLYFFVFGNFIFWADLYFIHLPLETSQFWQYGYKDVVFEVSKIEKNYDKVVVTGKYDQPYIFFLFFKKYDPQKYQNEYGNPKELPRYERTFGKYQFLEMIDLSKIKKEEKILIVGAPEDVGQRDDFKTLKKIDFLDGLSAFLIGEKI